MQSETPKQYLQFQGKTILEHCLDRLLSNKAIGGAILVLDEEDQRWEALGYRAAKPLFTTTGGLERQHSVYNGLTTLQHRQGNDAIVVVHDAARPLVRDADLARVIEAARSHEAGAILATPVVDTLKLEDAQQVISTTLSRDRLWRAMTPQVFHLQPLLNALKQAIDVSQTVTDDAAAIEFVEFIVAAQVVVSPAHGVLVHQGQVALPLRRVDGVFAAQQSAIGK